MVRPRSLNLRNQTCIESQSIVDWEAAQFLLTNPVSQLYRPGALSLRKENRMLRKILLVSALVFTAGNLAVGVTYAALCRGAGGARACGEICTSTTSGNCACSGSCTADERNWVGGAGTAFAEIEEGGVY